MWFAAYKAQVGLRPSQCEEEGKEGNVLYLQEVALFLLEFPGLTSIDYNEQVVGLSCRFKLLPF